MLVIAYYKFAGLIANLVLIVNILPFLNVSTPYGDIAVGALTLIALSVYRGPELWGQMRQAVGDLRRLRLVTD